MSTQNERELFYQWFESLDLPEGIKIVDMQYVVAAWNNGRTPLLSRIAELEDVIEKYKKTLEVSQTPFNDKEWNTLGEYRLWKRNFINHLVGELK